MKKHSLFLAIKEMQIKTTLRLHLTPVIITTIKNTIMTTNAGEDAVKNEHSNTSVGMQASTTTLENNIETFKKTKHGCHLFQQYHSWG
jgi:hypothetical protein